MHEKGPGLPFSAQARRGGGGGYGTRMIQIETRRGPGLTVAEGPVPYSMDTFPSGLDS